MFTPNGGELLFIALVLEGFLCGVYSGIFAMYLQYQASEKKDADKKQNIVFYSICALYILSVALFVADVTLDTYPVAVSKPMISVLLRISLTETTLFACCDFIAQFILIYRCWIVWGCNIRVVIIPSILTVAFLVLWLAAGISMHISSGEFITPPWGYLMSVAAVAVSLAVNALVTGLIVFRILKVFRRVGATSNDQILGTTGGSKLRRIVLIIIESGMVLFSVQLVRVVITGIMDTHPVASRAFAIITSLHSMLNGITPTTILVRTSMGLSFHDEKSMEEVAVGSVGFAFNHPNSVPETGGINIVGQDNGYDDTGIQQSNDINVSFVFKKLIQEPLCSRFEFNAPSLPSPAA